MGKAVRLCVSHSVRPFQQNAVPLYRGKETEMEKFITRAARLNKAYDIELIERELECGEGIDIIVKNHMMGICGIG